MFETGYKKKKKKSKCILSLNKFEIKMLGYLINSLKWAWKKIMFAVSARSFELWRNKFFQKPDESQRCFNYNSKLRVHESCVSKSAVSIHHLQFSWRLYTCRKSKRHLFFCYNNILFNAIRFLRNLEIVHFKE